MRVQINNEKLELEDMKTHPRYTRFGPFLTRNDGYLQIEEAVDL